jgi:hypothetical protein
MKTSRSLDILFPTRNFVNPKQSALKRIDHKTRTKCFRKICFQKLLAVFRRKKNIKALKHFVYLLSSCNCEVFSYTGFKIHEKEIFKNAIITIKNLYTIANVRKSDRPNFH